jgi:methionine synthase / methylenetetrahydrofolate reductase(NADPH)
VSAFLDAIRAAPLLWDGAMGTLLYERGIFFTRSFDELNLSSPELIEKLHREYIDAGADVIETNTFGANRVALARHGHAERMREINLAGVRLARAAARDARYPVYVAGSVGPSGIPWGENDDDAKSALAEQIEILVEGGADALLLETFCHLEELEATIALAKSLGRGIPVVAQLVFREDGLSRCGVAAAEVAKRLRDAGADVVGANCGVGPGELLEVGTQMIAAGLPVSLQPNAGLPRVIEGRTLYIANPEHFGVWARRALQAGVRLVGGCCGTTPEHTRRMLGAVRMIGVRPMPGPITAGDPATHAPSVAKPVIPLGERSRLGAKLARGEFAVSCELSSPAGTDPSRTVEAARRLLAGGVDHVNVADGPRATARLANTSLCALLEKETAVETLLHVCCRDRNFIGLVAHLLGAHALGQKNLVCITGDPPKLGDYPFATPVYDVDSIGLLRIAADLNRGLDPAGKEIPGQTSFVLCTGAEPAALDYDRELRRLEDKKAAGAEVIMTQPVYDGRLVERFLDDTRSLGLPILIGLLPLASHRNAEFLHHNVPGMQIPAEIRARMARAGQGPGARAEGVTIAREALISVRSRVAGAYIMPPFDRVESALEIVSGFLPSTAAAAPRPATAPAP